MDAADEDTRREDTGISGCFDDLSLAGLGIAGNISHISRTRVATVPLQITEIVLSPHAA